MWLVARNFPPPGGEPFSCGPDEWRVRWKEKWHHPGVSWETSLSAIQAICLCTVLIHNNSYLMTLSTWSRSRPRPVSRCQKARKNCLITGRNLEQSRVGCHVTTPVGFVLSWFLSTSFHLPLPLKNANRCSLMHLGMSFCFLFHFTCGCSSMEQMTFLFTLIWCVLKYTMTITMIWLNIIPGLHDSSNFLL